jgi:hypothetical protein
MRFPLSLMKPEVVYCLSKPDKARARLYKRIYVFSIVTYVLLWFKLIHYQNLCPCFINEIKLNSLSRICRSPANAASPKSQQSPKSQKNKNPSVEARIFYHIQKNGFTFLILLIRKRERGRPIKNQHQVSAYVTNITPGITIISYR